MRAAKCVPEGVWIPSAPRSEAWECCMTTALMIMSFRTRALRNRLRRGAVLLLERCAVQHKVGACTGAVESKLRYSQARFVLGCSEHKTPRCWVVLVGIVQRNGDLNVGAMRFMRKQEQLWRSQALQAGERWSHLTDGSTCRHGANQIWTAHGQGGS